MKRLVKDGILPNLDFTDLDVCVDCIKGKQTKHTKKGATRSGELLEIVHTDICAPFDLPSFVDALEVYIVEVERQLDKRGKIIRSDRGGEYYGRYDGLGQRLAPFAKLLEKHGICAQYTMPTLKTAVYLLNRVPTKTVPKTPFKLWTERKPSLRHLHVWGCPTEARIYNPHEKKLDFKTISGYFIGYPMKSKGYRFYCPNHSTKIVETGNARFIENGEIRGKSFDNVEQQINDQSLSNETITNESIMEEPQQSTLRSKDPVSFSQAIGCSDSDKWIDAMNDELKSMDQNKVWELVELPEGYKTVSCKWVFKTKRDSKGNIERHKARLVAKGFTQKGGIDYKETFFPVSKKESLRIIMALVAHFDLELHQMNVKTAFLNGSLEEKVYMDQPEASVAPIQKGDKFSFMQCLQNGWERKQMERIPYAFAVGSLMYAQTCTRPDISFAIGLDIVDTIEKPLRIYCDNSAAIFFSKNDKYSNGAKHMELKYFAVKEEVQKQQVSIEHINTELMVADPLTKGLPPKTFTEHVKRMGLDCNP
ncbi:Retrovirus-related Pol polyprotein from transposon TNT 1-94 [Vitis vinifera]|uniref:Retrovirus-related Pol polyprotein from transposon TNT 1-94 n=1 Tax=Vitis vinifera TaxID=29760 RepID=A0A438D6P2_VITVI|nr:Retrovirus-related Pol polyprotein from transposon TNT 1-94 [Vitis vinifera]